MPIRDFAEERRWQLIQAEMDRLYERLFPDPVMRRKMKALYAQNSTLNMLMNGSPKGIAAHRRRFLEENKHLILKDHEGE